MSNRHLARAIAMQSLYEWDFYGTQQRDALEIANRNLEENAPQLDEKDFTRSIVNGVLTNRDKVDGTITKFAPDWPLEKITMVDRTKTEDVLQHLHQIDERPWAEWRRGSPMTATQLAAMLKPFGVKPITIRFPDTGPAKGYHRASFDDAFSRYLGSSKVTPLQPNDFKGLNGPGTVTRENDVTASQHSNSLKLQPCYDVTAESTATDEREQDSPAQSPLSESRRRVAL